MIRIKKIILIQRISVTKAFSEHRHSLLLDVRSPGEYARGHVPGAVNLPLFSNEEREKVGTIYKKTGPQEALLKGLSFVGPRMADIIRKVSSMTADEKVCIYCWRGGKRSGSIGWLLDLAGFQVDIIEGGYKSYRHFVLDSIDKLNLRLRVLGGKTGAGKTEILHQLAKRGEQIIDLEGLANHKGSAFGWIGEAPQPSTEHFENLLLDYVQNLQPEQRIWIENESRSVGKVYLPDKLWFLMRAAPVIEIDLPIDERVTHLVKTYTQTRIEDLISAFNNLKKRLGGQHVQAALEALEDNNFQLAARIALTYYDKAYQAGMEKRDKSTVNTLYFDKLDPCLIADFLLKHE